MKDSSSSKIEVFRGTDLSSPLILIKIFEFLESVFIFLFPIALVTSITVTGILIYAGVICFVLLFVLNKKQIINNYLFGRVDVAFLIYIFAFSISKFFNSGFEESIHVFLRTCQDYFVYLWAVFYVSKSEKHKSLIRNAILTAVIVSLFYGMFQYFHLDFLHRQSNLDRLSGFHKNPYTYSGQLIILFFFLLNEWHTSERKMIWILPVSICLFCVLNTAERAVMLGISAGLILYFVSQKMEKKKFLSILLFLSLPILITMRFHRKVFRRIKNVVGGGNHQLPNVRLKLWGIALSIWKRNILFGVGEFPAVPYQAAEYLPVKYLKHAHNVYFQMLVTNGLIGTLAFINLICSFLRIAILDLKTNKYAGCLFLVIVAFLVEGIFEYFWGDSEVRYFILYFAGFVVGNSMLLNLKKV